jgi:2-polyprenyl-3-methyl-5-hydroxy-6-metoxy-1,4-benzoquinol methylase
MNKIIKLLYELGISEKNSLKIHQQGVRDNENVKVLKCKKSGVFVLDDILTNKKYYKKNIIYSEKEGRTHTIDRIISSEPLEDDVRRFEQNKLKFDGKTILDFGCGQGGFIKLIDKVTTKTVGIELNDINRKNLIDSGYDIRKDTGQLKDSEKFDYIILNHVFEHLHEPITIMKNLKEHLELEGEIIIEVPHSRDFLLNTIDNKEFKSFTFWSEHLILHTKESLEKFLKHCGFNTKQIIGYQRYPLSNHVYWMSMGKPGGHEVFDFMNKDYLVESYNKFLIERNETDTIIGYFTH